MDSVMYRPRHPARRARVATAALTAAAGVGITGYLAASHAVASGAGQPTGDTTASTVAAAAPTTPSSSSGPSSSSSTSTSKAASSTTVTTEPATPAVASTPSRRASTVSRGS